MNIYPVIRAMATAIWCIVGFILWIPLLTRSVMVFNGAMIFATVTRDERKLHTARELLDTATVFYVVGFRNIIEFTSPDPDSLPVASAADGNSWTRLAGFLLELCWTACWWSLVWNYSAIVSLLTSGAMPSGMLTGVLAFLCGGVFSFGVTVLWASRSQWRQ